MTDSELKPTSTEEIVLTAIARTLHVETAEIQPTHRVDALGLDSMRLMAVIARVEVLCDIELSPEQIVELLKAELVSDLVRQVEGITRRIV